jgi:hypothetical protein
VLTHQPADLLVFAAGLPKVVSEFPLALENAYLTVSQPTVLEIVGRQQGMQVTSGGLALLLPLLRILPTLPDPYLATYFEGRGDVSGAPSGSSLMRCTCIADGWLGSADATVWIRAVFGAT